VPECHHIASFVGRGIDTDVINEGAKSFQKSVHIFLGNEPARLIEFGAKPTQDRWRIRQLAFLESFFQARFPAFAFLGFENAIAMTGFGHVNSALLSANAAGSHIVVPFGVLLSKNKT
jgi:hypothetical protein